MMVADNSGEQGKMDIIMVPDSKWDYETKTDPANKKFSMDYRCNKYFNMMYFLNKMETYTKP
jgi:hypothetical protein